MTIPGLKVYDRIINADARTNSKGETVALLSDYKKKMSLLAEIREMHDKSGHDFIETRLKHVNSVFTEPSLTSHCDTLPQDYNPTKYKQIHLDCEKIDERSSNLDQQIGEVKKRMNESWTNLITTSVAIIVVCTTGALNSMSASTIITNLSPIVLNLLLSFRALFAAQEEHSSLEEKEKNLTRDYKLQRWKLDQYETSEYINMEQMTNDRNVDGASSGAIEGMESSGLSDNVSYALWKHNEESRCVSTEGMWSKEEMAAKKKAYKDRREKKERKKERERRNYYPCHYSV